MIRALGPATFVVSAFRATTPVAIPRSGPYCPCRISAAFTIRLGSEPQGGTQVAEFMLLMHGDSNQNEGDHDWQPYLDLLNDSDALRGGSAIGVGVCIRRSGPVPDVTHRLVGYIKIQARDLDHARQLVQGNPIYEAGGTVEIRELPVTD